MKRIGSVLFAPIVVAAVTLVPLPATATASGATERYIVVLADKADPKGEAAAHKRLLGAIVDHIFGTAIRGYAARLTDRARERISQDPDVVRIVKDRKVRTTAQSRPTGILRVEADRSPTADIDGVDKRVNVDVAVIDTGVDLDHPDLNVVDGKNCSTLGFLFPPNDDNGHGTHVAGTIGAKDNGVGVVGMAPGARIWPVKVLNAAGMGFTSDVVCGIDFVAANADEIEVANMSLGGAGADDGACGAESGDIQHEAICNAVAKGVTFVVAAGNDAANAAGFAPAAYNEVITVSALADFNGQPGGGAASTCREDQDDTFADFSNYGADVDIIAPGVCIESTWKNGGYNTISGTSMASPHVAGAAALYKATHPGASPAQVRSALRSAGTSDWSSSQDGDGTKEPLLNVSGF